MILGENDISNLPKNIFNALDIHIKRDNISGKYASNYDIGVDNGGFTFHFTRNLTQEGHCFLFSTVEEATEAAIQEFKDNWEGHKAHMDNVLSHLHSPIN